MNGKESPIGVFDSGIGGISVLRELLRVMPNERYLFVGDSANAPYGSKTAKEVCALTAEHIHALMQEGVKEVVIACNTATSAAAKMLRAENPDFPIIGIEPALKPAALSGGHPTVVVMATALTLREEKFIEKMRLYESVATVIPLPCPGLVELIEQGILFGEELDDYLQKRIAPVLSAEPNAVVLGCTHYPHVREAIQKAFGPSVTVYDGGFGTAKEARRQLENRGLLSEAASGSVELRFTKDAPRMKALAERLLKN